MHELGRFKLPGMTCTLEGVRGVHEVCLHLSQAIFDLILNGY